MKCENCGKNEVTFVYRSNVNGHVEEKHLCSDCAEKLGYTQRLGAQSQRMMQSFFGNSLFGNDFFDDFFSPMPSLLGRRMKSLLGRMSRMLEDPFDDFFAEMPALSASPVQQQEAKQEKKDDLVGQEAQSRFAYLRQMNALKLERRAPGSVRLTMILDSRRASPC